jgi:AcrR family transcriptional regulator
VGIRERRAREQAQKRAAILEAAHAIAIEEGWENVSIRRIAERIEFSAAMLYEYFPGKQDVLSTLAREGFANLAAALTSVHDPDPQRRLLALFDHAWRFALENRRLYELMHSASVFEFGTSKTAPEARTAFAIVRDVLADILGRERTDLDDLVDVLWAATSGLTMLTMFGRIAGGEQRAQRLLKQMVSDLLATWLVTVRKQTAAPRPSGKARRAVRA